MRKCVIDDVIKKKNNNRNCISGCRPNNDFV